MRNQCDLTACRAAAAASRCCRWCMADLPSCCRPASGAIPPLLLSLPLPLLLLLLGPVAHSASLSSIRATNGCPRASAAVAAPAASFASCWCWPGQQIRPSRTLRWTGRHHSPSKESTEEHGLDQPTVGPNAVVQPACNAMQHICRAPVTLKYQHSRHSHHIGWHLTLRRKPSIMTMP